MKILHTSDWHLGKSLGNFSRHGEQLEVMEEICQVADAHDVDAIVVAGDLFDTFNPPAESIELFYRTLKRLTDHGNRAVIAIAGNHDSPERIEAPDPLARECGIIFSGYPHRQVPELTLSSGLQIVLSEPGFIELKLPGQQYPLRILLTPYANELRMKKHLGCEDPEQELRSLLQESWTALAEKHCDDRGVNIMVSHLMMTGRGEQLPEEPDEEKPILHVGGAQAIYTENIPPQVQYVALGHLHRRQGMKHNGTLLQYSGSPLAYSFSEAGRQKEVLIVSLEPGQQAQVQPVTLTRGRMLLRHRLTHMEQGLQWLQEHREALLELTVVSDTYLTADQRRAISQAHQGIITLIPEVTSAGIGQQQGNAVDLTRNTEELFMDYFREKKGAYPNESIMDLFREITAQEDNI